MRWPSLRGRLRVMIAPPIRARPLSIGSRVVGPMTTLPTEDQLWWTDVFAHEERSRLHSSGDGRSVARGDPLALSAALGGPHLNHQRCHQLTLAVAGSGWVVGVAEAEWPPEAWPWSKPAWGLSAWGQAPVCSRTTLDVDDSDAPKQLRASTEGPIVIEIRLDPQQHTIQFVRDGSRLGTISCAPAQVLRPWAYFVPRSTPGPGDIATIVSHRTFAPPLFNVDGLVDLVAHLPDAKQSLALAWCESYGIDDLKQLSNPRHLVDALSLPEDDTAALLQRFLISRSPTSAPDGVALRHAHHPSRTPPRRQLPWQWPSSPTPCK